MFRLHLLGNPSIEAEAGTFDFKPRAVCELLALIMLRGNSGILRVEASEFLYGHLLELGLSKSPAQQLRINISRLKKELIQYGLIDSFELDPPNLRCLATVEVDILDDLNQLDLSTLHYYVKPFAPTWNKDRWKIYSEQYSLNLANAFSRILEHDIKPGKVSVAEFNYFGFLLQNAMSFYRHDSMLSEVHKNYLDLLN
jgi:hypothetical protein